LTPDRTASASGVSPREWDADTYDRISDPMLRTGAF
jgi:hypothetical protein